MQTVTEAKRIPSLKEAFMAGLPLGVAILDTNVSPPEGKNSPRIIIGLFKPSIVSDSEEQDLAQILQQPIGALVYQAILEHSAPIPITIDENLLKKILSAIKKTRETVKRKNIYYDFFITLGFAAGIGILVYDASKLDFSYPPLQVAVIAIFLYIIILGLMQSTLNSKIQEAVQQVLEPNNLAATYHAWRASEADRNSINAFFSCMQKFGVGNSQYAALRTQISAKDELKESKASKSEMHILDTDAVELVIQQAKENPHKKIAILNPANASTPGGTVFRKKGTLEEALCRRSDLFAQLLSPNPEAHPLFALLRNPQEIPPNQLKSYVQAAVHVEERAKQIADGYKIAPGTAHYHKNILFIKDPQKTGQLTNADVVPINVISAAAPNLNRWDANSNLPEYGGRFFATEAAGIKAAIKANIEAVISAAEQNGIEILVLSAIGCGAFRNDPHVVAECFREVFETHRKYIQRTKILFAIWNDPPTLATFKSELHDWLSPTQSNALQRART